MVLIQQAIELRAAPHCAQLDAHAQWIDRPTHGPIVSRSASPLSRREMVVAISLLRQQGPTDGDPAAAARHARWRRVALHAWRHAAVDRLLPNDGSLITDTRRVP